MSKSWKEAVRQAAVAGVGVDDSTARAVLDAATDEMPELFTAATSLRHRYFGSRLSHCSIINARSGACSEDCAFCAQSAHHSTGAEVYELRSSPVIRDAYAEATQLPVERFGVVTSGDALADKDVDAIVAILEKKPADQKVGWCGSLGGLRREQLARLFTAGMNRFHHNLETARSFFPSICTTHSYADRLRTLQDARDIGMELCCGGILGLGESLDQRVEFARTLAGLEVESIPLNFLVPIPGTPLGDRQPMAPLEILKTIAMFRLMAPKAEIRICAGRLHLRDLQSLVFYAGATGLMIGRLLTTAGRSVEQDLQMLRDLEYGDAL